MIDCHFQLHVVLGFFSVFFFFFFTELEISFVYTCFEVIVKYLFSPLKLAVIKERVQTAEFRRVFWAYNKGNDIFNINNKFQDQTSKNNNNMMMI